MSQPQITAHKDGSISIRLPRFSADGGFEVADLLLAVDNQATSLEGMALKFPAEADAYRTMSARFKRLAVQLRKATGRRL